MQIITPVEAQKWLQNDEAILIDVREQDEFDACSIDGAQLVPLFCLLEKIKSVPLPDNKTIIFQCLKGGRSAQAIEALQETYLKGYDLYNMTGGIIAWAESDLPIITPNK